MTTKQQQGQLAEDAACKYLQSCGLISVERNYSISAGEIDLIMIDNGVTVFVEVRYRQNINFGTPAETITKSKQQKLIKAAQKYLLDRPNLAQNPARFDVIAITSNKKATEIDWIQDAFRAE